VRATALGATTLVGPVAIPDGAFAWIRDPQGTTIGVIQPAEG
jgi:predicted enzyme related to lactoylglutathione lyase